MRQCIRHKSDWSFRLHMSHDVANSSFLVVASFGVKSS